eukprot:jgi/Galph1/4438/GphlegSOOS_G3103.1
MNLRWVAFLLISWLCFECYWQPGVLGFILLGVHRDVMLLRKVLHTSLLGDPCRIGWNRAPRIPVKVGQGIGGWPPRCLQLKELTPSNAQIKINTCLNGSEWSLWLYEEGKGCIQQLENRSNPSREGNIYRNNSLLTFELNCQTNYKVLLFCKSSGNACHLSFSTPVCGTNLIKDPLLSKQGIPLYHYWLGLFSSRTLKEWLPLFSGGYYVDRQFSEKGGGMVLSASSIGHHSQAFGALQPIWIPNIWKENAFVLQIVFEVTNVSDRQGFVVICGTESMFSQGSYYIWTHVGVFQSNEVSLSIPAIGTSDFLYLALINNATFQTVKILNLSLKPERNISTLAVTPRRIIRSIITASGSDILLNIPSWIKPEKNSLTLAIPLSMERLATLQQFHIFYPHGPIVVAIGIRNHQEKNELIDYLFHASYSLQKNVNFILVDISQWKNAFPINRLRNVALKHIQTEYVCVLDVDTFPSSCMFSVFPQLIERDPLLLPIDHPRCLVLTNWLIDRRKEPQLPRFHEQIKAKYNHTVVPYCKASQSAISFQRWLHEKQPFFVSFQPNFEPYCIMRTNTFIPFDERFTGYGFNKVAWTIDASIQGVEFLVDNRFFLFHQDHSSYQDEETSTSYLLNWIIFYAFVIERLYETVK